MKSLLKIAPIIFLFLGCGGSKLQKVLSSGSIVNPFFTVTVPFEYRQGLMVIKASVAGKEGDFILDTGASNVFSKELQQELALQPLDSEMVYGVHGAGQELEYASVGSIKIGDIDFVNTITAIHDLNAIPEIACINVDGIIGANLMRKAIWDIDFKNQKITITSTEDTLDIPVNHKAINFFVGYQGTPSISAKVNGITALNNRIDTGYTGALSLSRVELQKLINKNRISQYIKGTGSTSVGVYGSGKPEPFYHGIIDNLSYGDLELHNTVVSFTGLDQKLLGLKFLKNYRVILNWNIRKAKFIPTTPYNNTEVSTYGFGPSFKENKLYVKSIIDGSSANENGLKIGDQILVINEVDFSTVTQNQWCTSLQNGLVDNAAKTINMTIQRDSVITKLTLNKTVVLQ